MRAIAVTLASLASSLLLAACGGGGAPSARAIVDRMVTATLAQKTFHLVVNVANPAPSPKGLSVTFAEGDLAVPDRFRGDVTGTLFGVPLSTKLVAVKHDTFVKNPLGGGWLRVSVKLSPLAFFDPETGLLPVISHADGLAFAGTEDVDGLATYRLTAHVPASAITPLLGNPPSSRPVAVTVWVGKKDYLLRRVVLAGPLSKDEPADASRTLDVTRYGEPVTIAAPRTG
jgi:hypothetical protein